MDVQELVAQHYGAPDLAAAVLAALDAAGTDVEHLTVEDLYPADQLHAGGAPATAHLLGRLDLAPGASLLDVGCGVGGPARLAAAAGAQVTGVDLTPELVEAATALSLRVGLAGRTSFLTTAAERLPHEDDSFAAAMLVHVGMNLPDKAAVLTEVHRVLAPGARLAVYDQVRVGPGEPTFPLPWADDARTSFVETTEDYVRHLERAGFTVEDVEDRTASTLGAPTGPVSPAAVLGPAFAARVANNVAATRAGLLGAVLVLARA